MSIKLINNLDFAGKLNQAEAVTESGKNFLKSYKAYLFQNSANCGVVNNFIREAQKYSYDTGVMALLGGVLGYVTENKIGWKLASACESVSNNNSTYGYIAKLGIEQVEKLLELEESQIVGYIKSGALKGVQYIPEFRSVCKEVYNASVNETVVKPNYTMETPFSFVIVRENEQIFNVLGQTYKLSNGKVLVEACDDNQFNTINALLPNFKMQVDESLVYTWNPKTYGDEYKFTISESGIKFEKGQLNETFEKGTDWLQFADTYARSMFANEGRQFLNIAGNVNVVYEGIGNIALVDSAKVIESSNGSIMAIVEGTDNVHLNVARSLNYGTSNNEYEYMVEALDEIKKSAGIDLRGEYVERINEDIKKADPESYKSIQEQLQASRDAQMEARKEKIAMLAESFKNDPVKIALLNSIAKDLAVLENQNK